MIPYTPDLPGFPDTPYFSPAEVFSEKDIWTNPRESYLARRDNILRALDKLLIVRYNLNAAFGGPDEEIKIRIYRWLVSTEYNLETYKRIGRKPPDRPSQHIFGGAVDPVAYRSSNGSPIPFHTMARFLEAAGFQRVAIVKKANGLPIGNHGDDRPGPRVASGYTSVYPGAVQQEWYPPLAAV